MVTIFVVEHFNGKKTVNTRHYNPKAPQAGQRGQIFKSRVFFYSLTCKGKRNKSIVIMSLKPATKIV